MKIRNKRIIKVPRKIVLIQLVLLILMLSSYTSTSISDKQLLNNYANSNLEFPALELRLSHMNDSIHLSKSYEFVNSEITKFDIIKDYAYVLIHQENVTINNQSIIANIHYLTDNIWNNLVKDEKLIFYDFPNFEFNSSDVQINYLSENRTVNYNQEELKINYQSYTGVNYNNIVKAGNYGGKPKLWKSISELPTSPLINPQSKLDWIYFSSFNINKETISKFNKLSDLNKVLEEITDKLFSFSSYFMKTELSIRSFISYPILSYLNQNQEIIRVEYIANIISPLFLLLEIITAIIFFYYIKDSFEYYQLIHKRGSSMKNIRNQVYISSIFIPLIISLSFVYFFQYILSLIYISNESIISDTFIFIITSIAFQTIINSFIVINQFRKLEYNLQFERKEMNNLFPRLAMLALIYFLGKGSIQYIFWEITSNRQRLDYAINFAAASIIASYFFIYQKQTGEKFRNNIKGKIVSRIIKRYIFLILLISGLVLLNSFQYYLHAIYRLESTQDEKLNGDIRIRFSEDVPSAFNLSIDQLSELSNVISYLPTLQIIIELTLNTVSFLTRLTLIDNNYLASYECIYCFEDLLKDGNVYIEDRFIDNDDINIADRQAISSVQINNENLIKFDQSDIFLYNIGGIIMTYQSWKDLGFNIYSQLDYDLTAEYNIDVLLLDPQNIDSEDFELAVSNILKYPNEKLDILKPDGDALEYFTQMMNLTLIFSLLIFSISAILYFSVIINSKEFSKEIQQLLEKYYLVKEIKNIMLQINAITILFNFLAISFGLVFAYFDFIIMPDDFIQVFIPQLIGLGIQSAIQLGLTMILITKIKAR